MAVVKPEIMTSEYEMFSQYRKTKDTRLRDEIVSSYIYIAEILSRKFVNRGVEYDDIYQVACMGILYAVERFDPDKGVKFATYATPTVMGEIRKYFRDKGNFIRIPRRLYEVFYKAEKIKRMSNGISHEEIARILNIPEKMLETVYEMGDASFIKSLEYEAYADGEMTLANVIGVEDKHYLMIEDKDFVDFCMNHLTDDERKFIEYRFYDEKSQKEISSIMETSQMQVSRLEKRILKKLRTLYFKD
ncbi:MAG: sigma-70 family RNA polymerase sigma factor [Clostridia bacterium]|nr:sigma-70 family RNA polymerase sigma factor [Clostridia bacterium]